MVKTDQEEDGRHEQCRAWRGGGRQVGAVGGAVAEVRPPEHGTHLPPVAVLDLEAIVVMMQFIQDIYNSSV